MEKLLDDSVEESKREEVIIVKQNKQLSTGISREEILDVKKKYEGDDYCIKFIETTCVLNPIELPADIKAQGAAFKRDVERILYLKNGRQTGRRRGTLDPTAIWKLGVRDSNVFARNGAHTKDYAFYLLQDGSGSMGGGKEFESARTLAILEEGLRDYSALKITTFATSNSAVQHFTAKQFEDKRKFNHSYSFLKTRKSGGSNKDGYSIRIATKELLKRKEQEKVLFVLSDGLPSEYRCGFALALEDVKNAVEEARAKGVKVIAIMFGSDAFIKETRVAYEYMYQHSVISCNPKDIGRKLLPILKNIIRM